MRLTRLHAWPTSRRLWTLCGGLLLFTLVGGIANALAPTDNRVDSNAVGQDFMAFYSAGTLAAAGRGSDLYDFATLADTQRAIAESAGLTMVAPVAPWWNPPHVALLFAPLTSLSFYGALTVWTILGLGCLIASGVLLMRLVADASPLRRHAWLAPVAIAACPATLQALAHGQNTPLSLLLMTLLVITWRDRRPIVAGVVAGLLAYKPQLALIVSVGLLLTLGWRVLVGLMIAGIPQLLAMLTRLPGALEGFLIRSPANLHSIQIEQPYLWHRHATINAWLRHVLQGNAPGETYLWISVLAAIATLAVAAALVTLWWRTRDAVAEDDDALDRLIAATILATPLLVPFFFDYDLLLLCVAGVLIARQRLIGETVSPLLVTAGGAAFAWQLFNPAFAQLANLNLTAPLLVATFALHIRDGLRERVEAEQTEVAAEAEAADVRLAA